MVVGASCSTSSPSAIFHASSENSPFLLVSRSSSGTSTSTITGTVIGIINQPPPMDHTHKPRSDQAASLREEVATARLDRQASFTAATAATPRAPLTLRQIIHDSPQFHFQSGSRSPFDSNAPGPKKQMPVAAVVAVSSSLSPSTPTRQSQPLQTTTKVNTSPSSSTLSAPPPPPSRAVIPISMIPSRQGSRRVLPQQQQKQQHPTTKPLAFSSPPRPSPVANDSNGNHHQQRRSGIHKPHRTPEMVEVPTILLLSTGQHQQQPGSLSERPVSPLSCRHSWSDDEDHDKHRDQDGHDDEDDHHNNDDPIHNIPDLSYSYSSPKKAPSLERIMNLLPDSSSSNDEDHDEDDGERDSLSEATRDTHKDNGENRSESKSSSASDMVKMPICTTGMKRSPTPFYLENVYDAIAITTTTTTNATDLDDDTTTKECKKFSDLAFVVAVENEDKEEEQDMPSIPHTLFDETPTGIAPYRDDWDDESEPFASMSTPKNRYEEINNGDNCRIVTSILADQQIVDNLKSVDDCAKDEEDAHCFDENHPAPFSTVDPITVPTPRGDEYYANEGDEVHNIDVTSLVPPLTADPQSVNNSDGVDCAKKQEVSNVDETRPVPYISADQQSVDTPEGVDCCCAIGDCVVTDNDVELQSTQQPVMVSEDAKSIGEELPLMRLAIKALMRYQKPDDFDWRREDDWSDGTSSVPDPLDSCGRQSVLKKSTTAYTTNPVSKGVPGVVGGPALPPWFRSPTVTTSQEYGDDTKVIMRRSLSLSLSLGGDGQQQQERQQDEELSAVDGDSQQQTVQRSLWHTSSLPIRLSPAACAQLPAIDSSPVSCEPAMPSTPTVSANREKDQACNGPEQGKEEEELLGAAFDETPLRSNKTTTHPSSAQQLLSPQNDADSNAELSECSSGHPGSIYSPGSSQHTDTLASDNSAPDTQTTASVSTPPLLHQQQHQQENTKTLLPSISEHRYGSDGGDDLVDEINHTIKKSDPHSEHEQILLREQVVDRLLMEKASLTGRLQSIQKDLEGRMTPFRVVFEEKRKLQAEIYRLRKEQEQLVCVQVQLLAASHRGMNEVYRLQQELDMERAKNEHLEKKLAQIGLGSEK